MRRPAWPYCRYARRRSPALSPFSTGAGHKGFEKCGLEVGDGTNGEYFAHVIRAKKAVSGGTGHHKHDVKFHWTYVIKGWVTFDFKDVGHIRMEAGDSHYMPEGCHHELMAFSDDLEMIEMYAPGEIDSIDVPDFPRTGEES